MQEAHGEGLVTGWKVPSEPAQEIVRQDSDGEVEVDLDDNRGGEAVEVEEGELSAALPCSRSAGSR